MNSISRAALAAALFLGSSAASGEAPPAPPSGATAERTAPQTPEAAGAAFTPGFTASLSGTFGFFFPYIGEAFPIGAGIGLSAHVGYSGTRAAILLRLDVLAVLGCACAEGGVLVAGAQGMLGPTIRFTPGDGWISPHFGVGVALLSAATSYSPYALGFGLDSGLSFDVSRRKGGAIFLDISTLLFYRRSAGHDRGRFDLAAPLAIGWRWN